MKTILITTILNGSLLTPSFQQNDFLWGGDGSGGVSASNGRVDTFPNSNYANFNNGERGGSGGGDTPTRKGHSEGGTWKVAPTQTGGENDTGDNF